MRDPQGPRGILPDYTGVELPPFPEGMMWPMHTRENKTVKDEWTQTKDSTEIREGYMGVPYQKIAGETQPIVRPLWPHLPENAAELAEEILNEIESATSDRPWAEGYAAGIIKSQYRRITKPSREEGYQTDGDVLRSGHFETQARRKRRTPSPKYRPRIRAQQRRKATAPNSEPKQRPIPVNPIHGRQMPEWEMKLIYGEGAAPIVSADDKGTSWPNMQNCLQQMLIPS